MSGHQGTRAPEQGTTRAPSTQERHDEEGKERYNDRLVVCITELYCTRIPTDDPSWLLVAAPSHEGHRGYLTG